MFERQDLVLALEFSVRSCSTSVLLVPLAAGACSLVTSDPGVRARSVRREVALADVVDISDIMIRRSGG